MYFKLIYFFTSRYGCHQSCLNISDNSDIKAVLVTVESDSRQLYRYEGDSDWTGWLRDSTYFHIIPSLSGYPVFVGLSGWPGPRSFSTQNSLPSPPWLPTSSPSRTKPQRLTSLERGSTCWRISRLWSRHLPQRKWKIKKQIFSPTMFCPICLQKYQK